ncbi:MAG: hypothetical protein GX107_02465 [Clostridiales bacterium]|nr:hypothetical protein [Clostridiales bacterium]
MSTSKSCGCGFIPTVIVPGIGQSKTVQLDEKGNVIKTSWPLDIDMKLLKKKLIPSAVRMLLFRHDLGFSKKLKSVLCEALDPLKCNSDGSQKNNIKVVSYNYSMAECSAEEKRFIRKMVPFERFADLVGDDHVFYFSFNPFGRAYETIELLHDYIAMVKEKTGHDKVNIIPISLGGTIVTSYLDKYASDGDIHRVVGIVSAFDGSTVFSDILSKNIDLDNYEELFVNLLGKGDGGKLTAMLKKIPKKLVKLYINIILDSFIETVLLNSPMMWGILPAEQYQELSRRFLSGKQHEKLLKRTDEAWRVRSDFPALVKKARDHGIEMFSLCGYNIRLFAVASDHVTSDMIVDTKSASMGAFCAPPGGTLPDGYVQQNTFCSAHDHISPDNAVDASAGALPDTTWFYKNMDHEGCAVCDNLLTLAGLLISGDEITDVFSSPDYPQFNDFVCKS